MICFSDKTKEAAKLVGYNLETFKVNSKKDGDRALESLIFNLVSDLADFQKRSVRAEDSIRRLKDFCQKEFGWYLGG